ncbi:MAG: hypothetical protein KJ048_18155, partial [Dehalococcoidia bacterium]|nr:hypothetical protein [Dehalococcoidia bacterium]
RRYWNYYLLTSLGWDLLRSVCNAVVLVMLGGPLLRALLRFRQRFTFELGAGGSNRQSSVVNRQSEMAARSLHAHDPNRDR